MEKSNLELFKQALNEAWDNKIRREVESCTEEIVTSERHKASMRAILNGTYDKSAKWKLTRAKVVAILVAAALLLASCAVIYRNEIRDLVEKVFDEFSTISYSEEKTTGKIINDVYELTYVPKGYALEDSQVTPLRVRYKFTNTNNTIIVFEQRVLDDTGFLFDIENGYNTLLNHNGIDVYYKNTPEYHFYLWNDGNYSFLITSSNKIPSEEIQAILYNLTIK